VVNNLVSADVLKSWFKSLDKAQEAHQSVSHDFDDGLLDGEEDSDSVTFRLVLDEEDMFQVCNAFDTKTFPVLRFQPTRRTFEVSGPDLANTNSKPGSIGPPLAADAKARSEMLRQRYWTVHQRLQRSLNSAGHIQAAQMGIQNQSSWTLTPIESLTGSTGTKRILGMVTQMEEGKWFMEDPKASIELDFSQLEPDSIHSGFYAEGSICIAEGRMMNDRDAFLVQQLMFGAAEPKEVTQKAFPSIDFFGSQLDHRTQERLVKYERHNQDSGNDGFLVVSDVWLDDAKVFDKLRFVISGANSAPPFALVLMGNFATPTNSTSIPTYIDGFERLADLLTAAPELLQSTQIIIVPGPTDPTPSRDVLPSPALSRPIREAFEKRLKRGVATIARPKSTRQNSAQQDWPRVFFTSNPVRIRYCTKQLTFFREDVTNKLRRHCFLKPSSEDETLADHLVRTVCDQSHLCPLPISVKPVYWNYDHVLHLYPLPDFVRHKSEMAPAHFV
jgi:DNA polymerase epsilon subunit 2